jgi:hypothetical protein
MSDPVDILKELTKFDEEVAKVEKWALRKAVLTRLKTLAKVRTAWPQQHVDSLRRPRGGKARECWRSAGHKAVAAARCGDTCCV